jgi:dihydrofolate synthase/folylpolyglutamate synthase
MLQMIAPLVTAVIFTTAPGARALPADELAALARDLPERPPAVVIEPDPAAALARACVPGARVVVAGSIFLIGPLRGILR